MDESETTSAPGKSESGVRAPFSAAEIKSEVPDTYTHSDSSFYKKHDSYSYQSSKGTDEKPRTKRPYNKKQKSLDLEGIEKPAPKKRGRKSKKELLMMGKKSEYAQQFEPSFKKIPKIKSPSQLKGQKAPRKSNTTKYRKSSGAPVGPSVFDKKILAGPHLTMKQVLEYILTDHSYCVPPDPLPAVGSNHQMIRYVLGPKNGAKARSLPTVGIIETGSRSPITYTSLSRARTQLSMSSASMPSPPSKLEHLLKRGDSLGLVGGSSRFSSSRGGSECRDESDVEIDVEGVDPEPEKRVAYDVQKAKEVMNECGKYVKFVRDVDTGDDWESKVVRTGWTKSQSGLYDKVIGTLHAERLARLTYTANGDTEPVLRRASLDRTANRVRRIFGEHLWDTKLTQWLHSVLTEFLNFEYLAIYMDVLQTLKAQCPQLISRMMKLSIITPLQSAYGRESELSQLLTPFMDDEQSNDFTGDVTMNETKSETENDSKTTNSNNESSSQVENPEEKTEQPEILLPAKSVVPQVEEAMLQLHSAKNAEAFKTLLERQWDPFSPVLLHRLKKLSANPVFLMIAPGAIFPKHSLNRRLKQYYRMFNRVGKIIKVHPSSRDKLEAITPMQYLEKMISHARDKIRQVRHFYPDRPLFLVGWGAGSILAGRLSVTAGPVDGIVALGFPLHTLNEMYDEALKIFGGVKHPVLFVIGGQSSNNSLTDMELFRRRMACETSLVVVGSGNENLYVPRDHREKLMVTQSYVDKTVMDEIAYFVNLHSKHNQIIAPNISMKHAQFSKSQGNSDMSSTKKPRAKKRKSSLTDGETETFVPSNNDDSRDSFDHEMDKGSDAGSIGPSNKREDSAKAGNYDYGFDGPKFIPSNKSVNKRKAYYRPDPNSISSSITSSSCITASKLLQQSPNAKRRMSKPSGPSQRAPLINQQPSQRSSSVQGQVGQLMDTQKDDAASLYKYLSAVASSQSELGPSSLSSMPFELGQNDGHIPTAVNTSSSGVPQSNNDPVVSEKTTKKKSNSRSKNSRASKPNSSESPSSSIGSVIKDVSTSATTPTNLTPSSSIDMHKFVLQHQQLMAKQYEQQMRQERPQSSQLFKLLSPGAESDSMPSPSLPPTSATPESTSETRTALISKQSLVSNMSLPMIRLSRSEDVSQPKPVFVTASSLTGAPMLSSLPPISSDAAEKILLRTGDKSIMKLTQADLKNLIAGGRGIQLFTGLPGQSPVNIMVKKPEDSSPMLSAVIPDATNESSTSTSILPSISTVSTPSLVLSTTDTSRLVNLPETVIPSVIEPQVTAVLDTCSIPEVITGDIDPIEEQSEGVEPMEIDTEEEMSGLLISSTFSVCPTSGERVLPSASDEVEMSNVPTVNSVAEIPIKSSSNEDPLSTSTSELISVPIQVKSTNLASDFVGGVSTVTTKKSKELNLDETFKQVLSKSQELSSPSAGSDAANTASSTSSGNAKSASKVCFAVKSKPKNVVEDVKKDSERKGSAKKGKKTASSEQTSKSPPKPRTTRKSSNSAKATKNTSSTKSPKAKEKASTEQGSPKQVDDGKTRRKGKEEGSSSSLPVVPPKEPEPTQDKVDIPEKKSEESSEKAAKITESVSTAEAIVEPVAAEEVDSSVPSSDTGSNVIADSTSEEHAFEKAESESSVKSEDSKSDDTQQSKSSRVRRSARLKSVV